MPPSWRSTVLRRAILISFLGVAVSPAPGGEPGAPLDDRIVVKIRRAYAATMFLPERALPAGLPAFDAWCRRNQVRDGHRLVKDHGVAIRDHALFSTIGLDRIYMLRVPPSPAGVIRERVSDLAGQPWVEYAEPVHRYEVLATVPDDPLFPQQWSHENTGQTGGTVDADMDSTEAWDVATGDGSVIIAVLDSGVDTDHPDLVDNLLPGFDLTGSMFGVEDTFGHGTQVAGNAAAAGDNAVGVTGICWGCSILPIKIVGETGFATIEEIADGVILAADQGADAINMSFGSVGWSQAFLDAVDYAVGLGALPVAGSGNTGTYSFFSPAAFPQVVSVGGTDQDDVRFGDYGDHAELSAPSDFLTTSENGGYETFWGTSASSPLAAGLAGLLRAADGNLHVQELRQLLRLGADDQVSTLAEDTPGWDQYLGFGRLNAGRSLALVDGPWLALDRAHYLCGGVLHVDAKDLSAGAGMDVTVTGDMGGDVETVSVTPVTAYGYYRGDLDLAWAGPDGAPVAGDGRLHLVDGETIQAAVDGLAATAVARCVKRVCLEAPPAAPAAGDCDGDGIADPGETWLLQGAFTNLQTELMPAAVADLGSTGTSVQPVDAMQSIGDLPPVEVSAPGDFRVRFLPGSPAGEMIPMEFQVAGAGWLADPAACAAAGYPPSFTLTGNMDGGAADSWPAWPPTGLAGSSGACPGQFDLQWDAVPGASGYAIYRSGISCADAEGQTVPYATTTGAGFADPDPSHPSGYFYAVEAVETGTSCVTLRACVQGACLCGAPDDPENLLLQEDGDDLLLTWDDPGTPGLVWNIYRQAVADPAQWGAPAHAGVTDEDPLTPGIQFTDSAAVAPGEILFYRTRAVDSCGESLPS